MMVYCIRHGESTFNAEGRIQGQLDVPLSPLGHQQAVAVAQAMERQKVDAIYSSPLARSVQSAEPLAERLGLPIVLDPRLLEVHVGMLQGLLHDELEGLHPEETRSWRAGDPDYRIPGGGETRRELMVRGGAMFREIIAAPHERVVVFSHGGLISAAFKSLLDIPAERNPFALFNGSISLLRTNGQLKLVTLNQIDHLQSAGIPLATKLGDL